MLFDRNFERRSVKMTRDSRVWLLFLGLAVALTVACSACSSSSSPAGGDNDGAPSTVEGVPDAMTQG